MMSESAERTTGNERTTSDPSAQTTRDDPTDHQPTGTLVTARVPADEFALAETLTTIPDLRVTGASIVTAGDTGPLTLVWFQTPDTEALVAALDADPTITAAEALVHADNRYLYRIEWDVNLGWLCQLLLSSQGVLLDAQASEHDWRLQILYPDREALRETDDFCDQYKLSFTIEAVRTVDPKQTTQYGLTPEQYEALTVAQQLGYFAVPREADLEEVAAEVGVSHQALSERLRRGHNTIISAALDGIEPTVAGSPVVEQPFDSQR